MAGIHPDLYWVGADETVRSIKIEDIRALQSWVMLRPLEGPKKVCIMPSAERLTEEAANAFLKILEEPPHDTHLILTVAHTFQLLPTLVSRVVTVRMAPLSCDTLGELLKSRFQVGDDARALAYQAQGSVGLAMRYVEEEYGTLKNAIIDAFVKEPCADYFLSLINISVRELEDLFQVLAGFLHDVLLLHMGVPQGELIHRDRIEASRRLCRTWPPKAVQELLRLIDEGRLLLKRNVNPKLIVSQLAAHGESLLAAPAHQA